MRVRASTLTCAFALGLSYDAGASAQVSFGPNDVRTVFFIAKSQNRNRVDYGLSLDEQCHPRGSSPVRPYWRLFEEGGRLENLERHEHRAYGIAHQHVRETDQGHVIDLQLKALPERPIEIWVVRDSSGHCRAGAVTRIRGKRAELHSIFVQLDSGLLPRVESILVEGRALESHRYVRERLSPT